MCRFLRTVSSQEPGGISNKAPTSAHWAGGRSASSWPNNRKLPACGRMIPNAIRIREVLPAPFNPMRQPKPTGPRPARKSPPLRRRAPEPPRRLDLPALQPGRRSMNNSHAHASVTRAFVPSVLWAEVLVSDIICRQAFRQERARKWQRQEKTPPPRMEAGF